MINKSLKGDLETHYIMKKKMEKYSNQIQERLDTISRYDDVIVVILHDHGDQVFLRTTLLGWSRFHPVGR